ncbi:Homeodomain-like DNA binding domain-containing transcription factor [Phycomyces blakesleeanus NRRL 1555(-)]|uniref:Homeodomain-like DNA binding domain-containing transcription factor n=1 Tax=Phycomyces blakesleeanus (strain ATCC 8743b / DSM 1359 / FGSC 10004 / NBRC 33097 / NRRL 1555) TaxID=763407 RepID=A0A162NH99_PHYB8|nr:Homeodomain-like DNA binding domain-containing transcription factor [Phycomyces blakesleeanus NRRL 1555(-)]OAD69644.1 Homeodomain-like DNA binding domain-containing transcription factor [Phycomyces blakesleeanus NRRL 1555(-)]|eukprot:XP_018287684.1 Homeodomain-like DNA binding domain-containing transcription factor [Phycomyces blakesleeanus NRRL 1555(-)]
MSSDDAWLDSNVTSFHVSSSRFSCRPDLDFPKPCHLLRNHVVNLQYIFNDVPFVTNRIAAIAVLHIRRLELEESLTNGHGRVVNVKGGPEPMDYIVDQNEFIVETIATHTEYLKTTASSESSLTCPILIEKTNGKDIRMKEANTKRDYRSSWMFTFEERRDGLTSRTCILTEEHKAIVINFIDAGLSATVVEVTEHLLKQFYNLKVSCNTVYNFMRRECNLSLKKSRFSFYREKQSSED